MSFLASRRTALVAAAVLLAGAAYYLARPADQPPASPAAAAPTAESPAALLQVDPRPPGLLPGGVAMTADEVHAYRKAQAAFVRYEFVVNAALRDRQVRELEVVRQQPDPVAWLSGRVTADYHDGSSVLRVSVAGVSPREAAVLANAVAAAYLSEAAQKEVLEGRRRLDQLENAHAELTRALSARRQDLHQLAATAGVPPNGADQRALVAALYQERTGLRRELARTRAEADACPEPTPREKRLREELGALEARIAACEQADLELPRAELTRLEAAVSSVAGEVLRVRTDMTAPPRVYLLQPATGPGG